jgi:hypothetical protein
MRHALKLNAIVGVKWVDSSRIDGWHPAQEMAHSIACPTELDCYSVGYLIAETPDRIVITTTLNGLDEESDGALSPVMIPKCSIVRMDRLSCRAVK